MNQFLKISAIIPCFDINPFCEKVIGDTIPCVDHLILVDDGSKDGTENILDRFHKQFPKNIHLIRFPENRGKGFAIMEGFRYALSHLDFDVLVTLDGDGQHSPSDIREMAEEIQNGADFVIGERDLNQMPPYSRYANWFITLLLRIRYFKAPLDTQSGLRAFSKIFVREIVRHVQGGRYETEFRIFLLALREKLKIRSHRISTVYIEKNIHSHFRKIKDSLRIIKVFFEHLIFMGKV